MATPKTKQGMNTMLLLEPRGMAIYLSMNLSRSLGYEEDNGHYIAEVKTMEVKHEMP